MHCAQLSKEQHRTENGGKKHSHSFSSGELGVCMGHQLFLDSQERA